MSAKDLEALGRAILVQAAQAREIKPRESVSVDREADGRAYMVVRHHYDHLGVSQETRIPMDAVYAAVMSWLNSRGK